jgi:hypothetical protein
MPVSATEISTEGGRLPMVWWEQPEAADEFAIVLPGQWFGCGSPPTAYATLALQALGADVRTLTKRPWTAAGAALASLAERWQRTAPAAACPASSMEGAVRP